MFFKIRPPRLRACADGRGITFEDVSGGTGFEDVRTVLIEGGHEQSHTVRPADVGLRRPLMSIGQIGGQASRGHRRAVDVLVVEALVAHPFGERPGIGGEAGNADPEVVVDFENFLLMTREFGDGTFERAEDRVGGGSEGDAGRSLFDGLHGILDLCIDNERERVRARESGRWKNAARGGNKI